MGLRTILVLLVMVGGLAALLWFTDREPPAQQTAERSVLDGRSLLQCERMHWQIRGKVPVEIGHAPDGRFQIQEPIVDIASAAYLRQIVNTWDSAKMRRTPLGDDEAGRKQAGLIDPELKFVAVFPDGVRVEVEVGAPGPLGTTRFLRRDGVIWEGGEALVESMQVGMEDLRERVVFRNAFLLAHEVRVDRLLPSGQREVVHVRHRGDKWQLLAPIEGEADPVAAQRFLTAVLGLRVDDFKYGVVRPIERDADIVLTVRGDAGEEVVPLWEIEGQVFGELPGRGVKFSSDNRQYVQIFVNAADQLRARMLVPMGDEAFGQAVELVVDLGGEERDRLRLSRTRPTDPWRLLEPIDYAARATPCSEAVTALQQMVAKQFVADEGTIRPRAQDPRYGLGAGRKVVTTRADGVKEFRTLWIGNEVTVQGETMLYVCRSDEPDNVALVPAAPLAMLWRPWSDYCDLQVIRLLATVERVDLARREGGERSFRSVDGSWRLDGSGDPRPEVGEFANDELRDLVGQRAVDMRAGFSEVPDWGVVLARVNGDELGRIHVWEPDPDAPLIVRGRGTEPIGFELGLRQSRELRALWK